MISPYYLLSIYIFSSITGYEDNIFDFFSILHVQGSKFGGKIDKFDGKSKKDLNPTKFMEFVFSKSAGGQVRGWSVVEWSGGMAELEKANFANWKQGFADCSRTS